MLLFKSRDVSDAGEVERTRDTQGRKRGGSVLSRWVCWGGGCLGRPRYWPISQLLTSAASASCAAISKPCTSCNGFRHKW